MADRFDARASRGALGADDLGELYLKGLRVDGRNATAAVRLRSATPATSAPRPSAPSRSRATDGSGGRLRRHAVIRRHGKPRREDPAPANPERLERRSRHHGCSILAPARTARKPVLLFLVRPAGCSVSIRDPLQNHTHTVAVIPARYASTRFPGKALADIAGTADDRARVSAAPPPRAMSMRSSSPPTTRASPTPSRNSAATSA